MKMHRSRKYLLNRKGIAMINRAARIALSFSTAAFAALLIYQSFSGAGEDEPKPHDSGEPTANEQFVLELINRARLNPLAEANRLGIDIKEGLEEEEVKLIGPKPPLAMNKPLLKIAREHAKEMFLHAYLKHENLKGLSPGDRMKEAGYDWRNFGENIGSESSAGAKALHDLLIIDANVPGRAHRKNLLGLLPGFLRFREIGAGLHSGAKRNGQGLKDFLVEDFGSTAEGPFVLGVVYRDRNRNKFYDPGEGMAGITIKPERGQGFAVTGKAGGYAFPVEPGTGKLVIKASGRGLTKELTREIEIDQDNIKVDFRIDR